MNCCNSMKMQVLTSVAVCMSCACAVTGVLPAAQDDATRMGSSMMNPGSALRSGERALNGDFKVLVYGNSIALHGPKPDIGWTNNWGMAASAPDKDFAHLVVAGLETKLGKRADFRIRNIAAFERNFTTNVATAAEVIGDIAWKPDYVVVAVGENVPNIDDSNSAAYRRFLADIARPFVEQGAKVVLRSPFWRNDAKTACTAAAASDVGALYVDVSSLGEKAENKAIGLFKHSGVANHPGDLGMRRLADHILEAFSRANGVTPPMEAGAVGNGGLASPNGRVVAQEVRPRNGIGNFMAKVRSGVPVKIAYFGGSITEMDGWRRLSREWLKSRYPDCGIDEINAAIGGTGSGLGVYRYGQDVLDKDPDLVFVEFATNDAAAKPEDIWRNFDGIVRQTWQRDPKIDIIFVYTITAAMMSDYGNGFCNRAASAMERIADHYGIPSVCFGPRVAAEANAGRLVMSMKELETAVPKETPDRDARINDELKKIGKVLFARDGVHPALPGHGFYLESIKAAWEKFEAMEAPMVSKRQMNPFFDPAMESAKMVEIMPSMLSGEWDRVDEKKPNGGFARRFGCKPWVTKAPGSRLSFKFRGTQCKIYDLLGPACGQLWVTVDGKRRAAPVARFDSYCVYYRLADFVVYSGADGVHSVEIELDSEQPSRQPVAFRLKDPEKELASPKFNGTEWFPGRIMLVGDIVP